jgi:hypothetical protein
MRGPGGGRRQGGPAGLALHPGEATARLGHYSIELNISKRPSGQIVAA